MSWAQEELTFVRAAIRAITSGAQSYSIGSRSVTKGDLNTLFDAEERLSVRVERESGNLISHATLRRPGKRSS